MSYIDCRDWRVSEYRAAKERRIRELRAKYESVGACWKICRSGPKPRRVIAPDGTEYATAEAATTAYGVTSTAIRYWCKKSIHGWRYGGKE